jgi:hypothetical protein
MVAFGQWSAGSTSMAMASCCFVLFCFILFLLLFLFCFVYCALWHVHVHVQRVDVAGRFFETPVRGCMALAPPTLSM